MLSDRYGWTPNQIREISISDLQNYINIISVKNSLQKEESKKIRNK